MGAVGTTLELGVELGAQMELAAGQLDRFHQAAIGAGARDHKTLGLHLIPELVVELVAVAMALPDLALAVALGHLGAGGHGARVLAQTHGAALGNVAFLVGHQGDDVVLAVRGKLAGVGVGVAQHVAGKLHHHDLHTKADAKVGDIVLPGVLRGLDHALNAAVAKAAGHDDAVHIGEDLLAGFLIGQVLALHPLDLHLTVVLKAGVVQALHHGEVGVVQFDILAHQRDGAGLAAGGDAGHYLLPFGQVGGGHVQFQFLHHHVVEAIGVQHQRALVEAGHGQVLNDALGLHVAEGADLPADVAAHAAVGAQDDDVRVHAHALQLFHRVLGRFGLVFVGAGDVGHQHDVDVAAVVAALFQAHLTDGFEKRLALDVAGGAADLGNDHVGLSGGSQIVDVALDLVGDVGDDLHGLAQISALTLLVQHVPVHLAGGQVGVFVQVLIDEALVVAQIQIGLGAVVGHEHFAVLQRAHGARVHIDVGVQLLAGHLQAPALEQAAQRGCRNAFAQAGDNAAGDKNKLGCHVLSSSKLFFFKNSLSHGDARCTKPASTKHPTPNYTPEGSKESRISCATSARSRRESMAVFSM